MIARLLDLFFGRVLPTFARLTQRRQVWDGYRWRHQLEVLSALLPVAIVGVGGFGQMTYRSTPASVAPGVAKRRVRTTTYRNDNPRTAQIDTITVDTATNSYEYTFKIDGQEISYTADASATTAEIQAGLVAAVNAEPLVNGRVLASGSDPDIVLTARYAGVGFTVTSVDAKMSLVHTTADDDADPIPCGVLVVADSTTHGEVRQIIAAALTAKVIHATPTAVNDARYDVTVRMLDTGMAYGADIVADANATVQEIVEALTTALNAALPASTVVVTEDNAKLIFTAEVLGTDFEVDCGSSGGVWTLADSVASDLTDVNEAARGITLWAADAEDDGTGTAEWPANSAMPVLEEGLVVVRTAVAITETNPVYVGTATATQDQFTDVATANYLRLSRDKFRWREQLSATRAVLEISL